MKTFPIRGGGFVGLALSVLFFSAVIFLGFSFDHGLEMSDEGAYLLVAGDPWYAPAHGSFYGFALHPLWILCGQTVTGFRWGGLLVWLAACFYFANAVVRTIPSFGSPRPYRIPSGWIFGSLLVAGFVLYSDGVRTPNYNWLSHVGAALFAGAWLRAARLPAEKPSLTDILAGAAGFTLLVAGRWGCGLLILPLALWGSLKPTQPGPVRVWLWQTGLMAVLMIGLLAYFYVGVDSLRAGWWSAKLIFAQTDSHGVWLAGQYLENFVYYLYRIARAAIWILPLVGLVWIFCRIPRLGRKIQPLSVALVCFAAVILALARGYWKGGTEYFSKESVVVGLWLASVAWLTWRREPSRFRAEGLGWWLGFFAALPWLLGLATDTSLADYSGHGAVFTVAAGWLLLAGWLPFTNPPFAAGALILALASLQACRVGTSTIFSYRIGNVWEFASPVRSGSERERLRLDTSTADLVFRLDAAMREKGFQTGDPIIALTDMPGLVYLLGGKSPGVPWYFGMSPRLAGEEGEFTRYVLSSLPTSLLEECWVLVRIRSCIPKDLSRLWPDGVSALPAESGLEIPWNTFFSPGDAVRLYIPSKNEWKK